MVDGVDLISSKRLEEAKYTYFFLTRDGLASARRARAANDPTPSSSSSSASLPSTSGPAERTPPRVAGRRGSGGGGGGGGVTARGRVRVRRARSLL